MSLPQPLQQWLSLQPARVQRRFLERHMHLIDTQFEAALANYLSSHQLQEAYRVREAWVVLRDIHRRGGSKQAIGDAYVNACGGFALDVPRWLEHIEHSDMRLRKAGRCNHVAQSRVALWRSAINRIQKEMNIPRVLLAEAYCRLWDALNDTYGPEKPQAQQEGIASIETALSIYTFETFPVQWGRLQNKLGFTLWERHRGELAMKNAVACHETALKIFTLEDYPSLRAETLSLLGFAYLDLLAGEERKEVLEKAKECYEAALHIFRRDLFPREWAIAQSRLGSVYIHRLAGERLNNQEQAIEAYQAALDVQKTLTQYPEDWAYTLSHLADLYRDRISGDPAINLDSAIHFYEYSRKIYTIDIYPDEWSAVTSNLGDAYRVRSEGSRADNIEQAITYYKEALRVRTPSEFPRHWAHTMSVLGIAYMNRIKGDREENIEKAIRCFTDALTVRTRESSPLDYAHTLVNLADAYMLRIASNPNENLETAARLHLEALEIRTHANHPQDWAHSQARLGDVYCKHATYCERTQRSQWSYLEQAIQCYSNAIDVYRLEAFPEAHRQLTLSLAEIKMEMQAWRDANELYQRARAAERILFALTRGFAGQDAILKAGREAAIRHGYVLIRLGRLREAAVAIESGRARVLAEAKALDAADSRQIHDDTLRQRYEMQRQQFIDAQNALQGAYAGGDGAAQRTERLRLTEIFEEKKRAFDQIVDEIRKQGDPVDFLYAPVDAETILRATVQCGPHHAIIYLGATPWGGFALAGIPHESQGFVALDLPELTGDMVDDLIETRLDEKTTRLIGGFALAQVFGAPKRLADDWGEEKTFQQRVQALHDACQGRYSTLYWAAQDLLTDKHNQHSLNRRSSKEERGAINGDFSRLFLSHELNRCMTALARVALHPLAEWLNALPISSLTLIPCGQLAAFPLLAGLLPNERTLMESYPSSVAPSSRTLLQKTPIRSMNAGVFAIGNPTKEQDLPWSEAEALAVVALAQQRRIPAAGCIKRKARLQWLFDALQRGYMVDASCHGVFDIKNVLNSGLRLADGSLSLTQLLSHTVDMRGLRLLILSACQTAIIDLAGARDEVHSLTSGMLQAGACAVLGTLWPVSDEATYLLITRFVHEWLPNMEHEPPASALARAQQWLRSVTNDELLSWQAMLPQADFVRRYVRRWRGGMRLSAVRGATEELLTVPQMALYRMRAKGQTGSTRPFADPYFWMSFQTFGW